VLDHRLPRREVAGPRGAGGLEFLVGGEELGAPDLTQVDGQRVSAFATDQLGLGAA
jgi:hypothetical protein